MIPEEMTGGTIDISGDWAIPDIFQVVRASVKITLPFLQQASDYLRYGPFGGYSTESGVELGQTNFGGII